MKSKTLVLGLLLLCAGLARAQTSSQLELKQGDHIAIIGDMMADRFQHSGWMETYIVAKYPRQDLVFRNLAVPGDEVVTRARSENFGTPDEWLARVKADVIFAFFGYNESFKGHDGLEPFKSDLDNFLKETLAKNYSGKGHPRVVLFSPVANEKMKDPDFPDPTANNNNIREYTQAMAEVAKANGVLFVDLFNPSVEIYAEAAKQGRSLTINGLYLNEAGDNLVAGAIFKGLFGGQSPMANVELKGANLDKLHGAINDKNEEWHSRYRTIDGYNVYGGRSALAYAPGRGKFITDRNPPAPWISNYKVMQEEMTQRDVMTANRDQRVWAVAKGGDLKVDDSNLPQVTKVPTDLPGTKPDESYVYLGGEEAINKMTVHSHMKVNLFASEEKFPELANPVQMAWDTKGRLWVAAWKNYPERTPTSTVGDSLLIFEDTDGDGKADKVTHFMDDLNAPTGFQFYKDGVLLMQAPDLWFVGGFGDSKANGIERVLMGMDSADSHHTANSLCLDPGGATYLSDGVFHRSHVETEAGPVRNLDGAIYRFEPRTGRFETYASYGFANPHGRVWTYWGDNIITDATGNNSYFGAAFSGHLDYPHKHPGMQEFWNRPSRPCAGTGLISSRHFPDEFQGDFLNCNVISFQGIYLVKVSEEGSGLRGDIQEALVSSSDSNFRPSAVNVGPDGAIYFADWHKPLIGHMQHHLRDPNRDHEHGRIYRITYEGRPLLKPAKIDGQPIPALLELLKEPENNTRERAKIELGKHDSAEVIAAVDKWVTSLDKNDPAYEHNMLEALWVHQWHNVVSTDLLKRMLHSPEPHARAAAGRVLCYWRDRVPDALALFKVLADDENPRVRLEAVRAASFFNTGEAVDVAVTILKHSTDYYLNYTLHETLRQLEPIWRKAVADGQPIAADNPQGLGFLLRALNTDEVLKMPHTPTVLEAILDRADAQDSDRVNALVELAKAKQTSRMAVLFAHFGDQVEKDPAAATSLARLLPWQLPDELKANRTRLAQMAASSGSVELRRAAWAGMALADNSFDAVWAEAVKTPFTFADLLNGIALLNDADFRATAYDRVKPLLGDSSDLLKKITAAQGQGVAGRYVRVELPRQGTLTLSEVQIFSGGKNVALQGKAKQSSTAFGGAASRAIDGGTDGSFGSGTLTHTKEDEDSPWWEVDLGGEKAIDSIAVWNRTDEELGKRLDGFTLTVLDGNRREVFKKAGNPAPDRSATITIHDDAVGAIRRGAIRAIVSMRHEPEAVFASLTDLLVKGVEVPAAAQGMRVLPRQSWVKAQAGAAAGGLVAWAKTIPSGDRTTQDYIQTVQLADDLTGLMPAENAGNVRKELKDLRVAIFVIHTLREQMRYDTPRLVVEAGKPFELRLENDDFMPHNLVIVKPNTREKVGLASALMKPDALDKSGRAYIPKTKDIIGATKLLNSGETTALKITAPETEGDYEYVCTFPGHYQMMWGQLIVTRDVDGYLRAHPEVTVLPSAAGAGHDHHHAGDE